MKRVFAVFVLTMTSATVFAQDGFSVAAEAVNETTSGPTEYSFLDDQVEGVLPKPVESLLPAEAPGETTSLIRIRASFVPELLMSVENI